MILFYIPVMIELVLACLFSSPTYGLAHGLISVTSLTTSH